MSRWIVHVRWFLCSRASIERMDVRFYCIVSYCPTRALRSRHRMLSLDDDGASTIHATVSYFIPLWQVGGGKAR